MPGGRPSPIDAVIAHREEDGSPVTVFDRIVNALLAGNYFEHACASGGITSETGYEWQRRAGRILIEARGRDWHDLPNLTEHDRRCIEFSEAVATAEGQWVVNANATLELLGRGGYSWTEESVEYDSAGNVVKRTETTKYLPPNAQVIEWRMTRRFPHLYGNRLALELPNPGQLSSADHAAALLVGIDGVLAENDRTPPRPKAIDATSTARPRTTKPRAKKAT